MRRGDLFLVKNPQSHDPRKQRVFLVVSRQTLIDSRFSTVICAPVYTAFEGLSTQVPVGPEEGLKHANAIHCDELVSLPKRLLSHYVGTLSSASMQRVEASMRIALSLQDD